jgi:ComF family protein|tara:strand:+ start:17159 stop:17689 length:531 start_codon:yes stop_codon:yes gene_type:complete
LEFTFEFARAAASAHGQARELMHAYKYGRQIHLHRELALLTEEAWDDPRVATQCDPPWVLVPVPLHWRRQRWRWFNQSYEIARILAQRRKLRCEQALRRVRHTNQQTLLNRTERLANLRGAFRLSGRERRVQSLRNNPVLLVDDVFTTGSTAEECARVLIEEGGAEKVVVLTVLRG